MDDTMDCDLTMPVAAEDKQEKIKEDCNRIADLFEASSTATFQSQDGLVFHLEFDDAEKFEKFAKYLRAQGLLGTDATHTKSDRLH